MGSMELASGTSRGEVSEANREIVAALLRIFYPLTARLTPEIEPMVVYDPTVQTRVQTAAPAAAGKKP